MQQRHPGNILCLFISGSWPFVPGVSSLVLIFPSRLILQIKDVKMAAVSKGELGGARCVREQLWVLGEVDLGWQAGERVRTMISFSVAQSGIWCCRQDGCCQCANHLCCHYFFFCVYFFCCFLEWRKVSSFLPQLLSPFSFLFFFSVNCCSAANMVID